MNKSKPTNDAARNLPAEPAAAESLAAELKPIALGAPRLELLSGAASGLRFGTRFVDSADLPASASFGEEDDEFSEDEEEEFDDEEEEEDEFDEEDDDFDDEDEDEEDEEFEDEEEDEEDLDEEEEEDLDEED